MRYISRVLRNEFFRTFYSSVVKRIKVRPMKIQYRGPLERPRGASKIVLFRRGPYISWPSFRSDASRNDRFNSHTSLTSANQGRVGDFTRHGEGMHPLFRRIDRLFRYYANNALNNECPDRPDTRGRFSNASGATEPLGWK